MKKIKSIFLLMVTAIVMSVSIGTNTAYAATGTPISTAEEFLAIANNPAGSYYLANDITLPANATLGDITFTGTLDGNNHKIKGYTFTGADAYYDVAIFPSCKNATFKNLSLTNVNININSGVNGAKIATLAGYAKDCTFTNIKTSGTITLNGAGDMYCSYYIGGIIGTGINCTLKKCTNSINIKVNCPTLYYSAIVCGIGDGLYPSITDCTNKGSITLNGTSNSNAYGLVSSATKATNCKNSGNITVTYTPTSESRSTPSAEVAGMCSTVEKAVSCYNTGAIKLTCNNSAPTVTYVAGLICKATSVKANITKCSNKGKVTFSGVGRDLYVGGVVGDCAKITQCYNTGKVSATNTSSYGNSIGGLTGRQVATMKNCYNTGAITLKGEGNVGGLTGVEDCIGDTVTCCYSTGKVTGKKGANKGLLVGSCVGAQWKAKRNVYNNYYTGSGKPYGTSTVTWHEWVAKATKVSSITASNCPKLSSKYWTYSAKKKRLILKSNKEK